MYTDAAPIKVERVNDTILRITAPPATVAPDLDFYVNIPGDGHGKVYSVAIEDDSWGAFASQTIAFARTNPAGGITIASGSVVASDVFKLGAVTVTENAAGSIAVKNDHKIIFKVDGPFYVFENSVNIKGENLGALEITDRVIKDDGATLEVTFKTATATANPLRGKIEFTDLTLRDKDGYAPKEGEIKITAQFVGFGDPTGLKVADRALRGVNFEATDKAVFTGKMGVVSARVTIKEDAPDSWTARETIIQLPDGVSIISADYTWNEGDWDKRVKDVKVGDARHNNILFLRDDQVSITPDLSNTRSNTLVFELKLSVEAGYVAADGSRDIVAEVTRGDSGFKADSVVLATVSEPIGIKIDGLADGLVGSVNTTFDIEISEVDKQILAGGKELWIYILGGDSDDLVLNVGRRDVTSDNSTSGLRVSYQGKRTTDNSVIRNNALVLDIDAQSWSISSGGTITLKDVQLSGNLVAGVDYFLVVSGDAIISNNEEVAIDGLDPDGDITERAIYRDPAYFAAAYKVALATTPDEVEAPDGGEEPEEPGDPDDPDATDPGDTEPALINPDIENSYTFVQGEIYGATGGPAFIMVDDPNNPGFATSYIMATALCNLLGFVESFADGVGTWEGYNAFNEFVSISMRNGETTVMVSYDFEDAIPFTLQASSGIVPAFIHEDYGRFYVPVKAFEAILDIVVTWDGDNATVTVN
ncbi:MAG: hypothetical protein FWE82_05990 [Defluviitaleaceae bacterium]|nr:hypothetical protein [Defluviitaleaceae bacterium]